MTSHEPRDPDIAKKPQAKMWFEMHPDAREHFNLARRILVSYYSQENRDASHGYVNIKNAPEYRFNGTGKGYVWITGSIKHSTVRFFGMPKNSVHERFRKLHWNESNGRVEFLVSDKSSADELEAFLIEPFHKIENFRHYPSSAIDPDACVEIVHTLEALGVEKERVNEVLREVWMRTPAHAKFRKELMKKWGGKCALTGIEVKALLVASHIKPWAESRLNPEEQTCIDNGLILASPIDKLFDRGYLTFDDEGTIQLHDDWDRRYLLDNVLSVFGLSRENPLKLGLGQSLVLNTQQRDFLKFHRKFFGFEN